MELHERKELRLTGYDYDSPGGYFITVCTKDRHHILWEPQRLSEMRVGADIIRPQSVKLSQYGMIVDEAIRDIPIHYANVAVDHYVIMPNHIHLILRINGGSGRMVSAPTKSLSTIVGQMKRAASKAAGVPLWQKSYHDHIIRNHADYLRVWEYIDTNPAKWREDRYYKEGL